MANTWLKSLIHVIWISTYSWNCGQVQTYSIIIDPVQPRQLVHVLSLSPSIPKWKVQHCGSQIDFPRLTYSYLLPFVKYPPRFNFLSLVHLLCTISEDLHNNWTSLLGCVGLGYWSTSVLCQPQLLLHSTLFDLTKRYAQFSTYSYTSGSGKIIVEIKYVSISPIYIDTSCSLNKE
jgi:hypothetical protein